jgi:hypothetical protein
MKLVFFVITSATFECIVRIQCYGLLNRTDLFLIRSSFVISRHGSYSGAYTNEFGKGDFNHVFA